MRAGRLNTHAQLLNAAGDVLGSMLIGITEKDGPGSWQPGLIQPQSVTVRARWNASIRPGLLLATRDRLLLIGSVADPDGRRQDLLISAQALDAPMAAIAINDQTITARCALLSYRAAPEGEHSYLGDAPMRRQAEFCNAEHQPGVGQEFVLDGAQYRVLQIDADNSTAVITRCWIEFLQYIQE